MRRTSLSDLDERIAALPAAKVTPARIAEVIVGEAYHRLTDTLTVCVLSLANGFTVTGESACASPSNYNAAIGNALARICASIEPAESESCEPLL